MKRLVSLGHVEPNYSTVVVTYALDDPNWHPVSGGDTLDPDQIIKLRKESADDWL